MNDIQVYNPIENNWTELECDGAQFEQRRNHSACIIGKHLIVYGGINCLGQYLSDIMVLNFVKPGDKQRNHHWVRLPLKGVKPPKLAYHTAQLVLNPERYRFPGQFALYNLPDLHATRTRIEIEGIYIFGGRDEKGPKNSLYILTLKRKPCELKLVEPDGQPPLPRYGHTMNLYPDKNIIIVFGGRNDENYYLSGEAYLNDVWVLYLERLTWAKWDIKEGIGSIPDARYSHCSTILGTAIIIFGGLSENNYCKADIHALEIDSNKKRYGHGSNLEESKSSQKESEEQITEVENEEENKEDSKEENSNEKNKEEHKEVKKLHKESLEEVKSRAENSSEESLKEDNKKEGNVEGKVTPIPVIINST